MTNTKISAATSGVPAQVTDRIPIAHDNGDTTFSPRQIPLSEVLALGGGTNKVLNGDCRIDQMNEGAAVTLVSGTPAYCMDGFLGSYNSSASGVTIQRVTDAPTGYAYSVKMTVGTGAAVSAGHFLQLINKIEGIDAADMLYGTVNAAAGSLSFWVKSSILGTFSYRLTNSATNRSYVGTFAIAATNTWTQILLPNILGDTTGTWLVGEGQTGLELDITMSAGSTFQTSTLNAWQGANVYTSNAATNTHLSTSSSTFQVTGLKFEKNTHCTSYVIPMLDRELLRAKRLLEKSFSPGTAPAQNAGVTDAAMSFSSAAAATFGMQIPFEVSKAKTPTITTYNPSASNANWRDITNSADRTVTQGTIGRNGFILTGASGAAAAQNKIHFIADARL